MLNIFRAETGLVRAQEKKNVHIPPVDISMADIFSSLWFQLKSYFLKAASADHSNASSHLQSYIGLVEFVALMPGAIIWIVGSLLCCLSPPLGLWVHRNRGFVHLAHLVASAHKGACMKQVLSKYLLREKWVGIEKKSEPDENCRNQTLGRRK